jgi:hypothetical protein
VVQKKRYNYKLTDAVTRRTIMIPEDLGKECKRLNISVQEILNNYNEYNSLGMRATYGDGAQLAIYLRKKEGLK